MEYADLCDFCRYHRPDWRQDVYMNTVFWRGYFASVRSRCATDWREENRARYSDGEDEQPAAGRIGLRRHPLESGRLNPGTSHAIVARQGLGFFRARKPRHDGRKRSDAQRISTAGRIRGDEVKGAHCRTFACKG